MSILTTVYCKYCAGISLGRTVQSSEHAVYNGQTGHSIKNGVEAIFKSRAAKEEGAGSSTLSFYCSAEKDATYHMLK